MWFRVIMLTYKLISKSQTVLSEPSIPGFGAIVDLGGLYLGYLALQRRLQGVAKLGRNLLPELSLHLLDHGVGEDLGEEHRRLHVLVGDQEIL